MSRLFSILFVAFLVPSLTIAQAKLLTVEDASNMNPKLNAASLSQLQWRKGTNHFVYVVKNRLLQGTMAKTGRDTLVWLSQLNALLIIDMQDTLKRFPAITFLTENQFSFTNANKLFLYDLQKNLIVVKNSWKDNAENLDIDKAGNLVAYTVANNLYISDGGKETAVSAEANEGILYGSSRVHRNEFGIGKGTFWSPDGQYLAFYRMDETMVAGYPLVDITPRIATVRPTKYPMAGMTSHQVTIGVYSVVSGKTIYLQANASPVPDTASRLEYLTNITWSPDGRFFGVLSAQCCPIDAYGMILAPTPTPLLAVISSP